MDYCRLYGYRRKFKEALKEYTESDQAQTTIDTDKAVELMLLKYDVIQDMLYNLDYSKFNSDKNQNVIIQYRIRWIM